MRKNIFIQTFIRDKSRHLGFVYFIAFIGCIPSANWLIGNIGTSCTAQGPCLIPVGFDLMAPSGVLMVGLGFVLRDLVQRHLGKMWSLIAIALGAAVSALLVPAPLVIASASAFILSELADFAVYTPLQKRRLVLAVLASSVVGIIIDSMLFLWLAFGSLDFLTGQIIGKMWMVILALPFIWWLRVHDEKRNIVPA